MTVTYFLNECGVREIRDWLIEHHDHNPKVRDLCAEGIAYEVNQMASLDEELDENSRFGFAVGLRDGRGHPMILNLYPEHFDAREVQ